MPRIEEVYNTNAVLEYVQNLERDYTLGDTLFPEAKIDDFEADIIVGANNLPVSASIHAWDTEAEIGDREGFDVLKAELALVKRKIRLKETDIIRIRNPRTTNELSMTLSRIYDDAANMIETVQTRVEAMRFEVLATGRLVFDENGYTGTVDYLVPSENRITTSWAAADANPIADIAQWQEQVAASSGSRPTRALTSTRVLGLITGNTAVRSAIFGNALQMVTRTDLNDFLAKSGLPVIATDDRTYRVKNGKTYTTKRFFPEDTFVMFPDGALGETVYGLTAEELELTDDASVVVGFDGNIVTTVYKEKDPVATWTKATAVALPTFPVANQVIFATGLVTP